MCFHSPSAKYVDLIYAVNDTNQMSAVEDDFLLSDPANEKKLGVNLKDALERAKENKGKLFDGMTFYITPKIPVGTKLLKNVITAGGGKVRLSSSIVSAAQRIFIYANQHLYTMRLGRNRDTYCAYPESEFRPLCDQLSGRQGGLETVGRGGVSSV